MNIFEAREKTDVGGIYKRINDMAWYILKRGNHPGEDIIMHQGKLFLEGLSTSHIFTNDWVSIKKEQSKNQSDKKKNKCPHGGKFGYNFGKYQVCPHCFGEIFEDCFIKAKELKPKIPDKKQSNLATVKYKEQNGNIRIVSLDNFLTGPKISEKYGERVYATYQNGNPRMYGLSTGEVLLADFPYISEGRITINSDTFCTQQRFFDEIIAYMKECGARLGRIVKVKECKEKKSEIKEIQI